MIKKKKEQLAKAILFLEETLSVKKDRISTAATVQAFEMAIELSWKFMKVLLEEKGGKRSRG